MKKMVTLLNAIYKMNVTRHIKTNGDQRHKNIKLIYFSYMNFFMKINQKPHIMALFITSLKYFSFFYTFFFIALFCVCYCCLLSCKKVFQQLRNNVTNSSVLMPFVIFVVRKVGGYSGD